MISVETLFQYSEGGGIFDFPRTFAAARAPRTRSRSMAVFAQLRPGAPGVDRCVLWVRGPGVAENGDIVEGRIWG